ncbi:hypothetical protein K439DRAFT_1619873 [Ramaria rubella]|nr:hypothetical protein K439DRAFT_1619873 [Ramaria rubella]
MTAVDYTPEFCGVFARIYWRNRILGGAPWYGTDMKGAADAQRGSLFMDETKHWNVAELPSVLTYQRLSDDLRNHRYVEDLFSINYIHFGSPSSEFTSLPRHLPDYFPIDNTPYPQSLHHKSFLASPTLSSNPLSTKMSWSSTPVVVTFLHGYHAGFNLRFNYTESVTFALEIYQIELGLRFAFCAYETDSVRIVLGGLIDAKKREKKTEAEAKISGPSPNRKWRVEVVIDEGQLRVQDAPMSFRGVAKPKDGVLHDGEGEGRVGRDETVKDCSILKCSACSRQAHGAPIQCTKGKCSKAFHVGCAAWGGEWCGVLEEVEKEVVLVDEVQAAPPVPAPASASLPRLMMTTTTNAMDVDAYQVSLPPLPSASAVLPSQASTLDAPPPTAVPPTGLRVIKTIKKDVVEVLCSQHHLVIIAQKKANKNEKVRTDLAALSEMSRIRIRNSSGLFEQPLVKARWIIFALVLMLVHTERETVVLSDGRQKRVFRWGRIDRWGACLLRKNSSSCKQPPPGLSIFAALTMVYAIAPLCAPEPATTVQRHNSSPSTRTRATPVKSTSRSVTHTNDVLGHGRAPHAAHPVPPTAQS